MFKGGFVIVQSAQNCWRTVVVGECGEDAGRLIIEGVLA
jgi:hypothetical protein